MKETIIEHISTFQYNPGHDNSADGSRDKPENVSVKCAKYNSANQDSCPFIFVWLQAFEENTAKNYLLTDCRCDRYYKYCSQKRYIHHLGTQARIHSLYFFHEENAHKQNKCHFYKKRSHPHQKGAKNTGACRSSEWKQFSRIPPERENQPQCGGKHQPFRQ